MKIYRALFCLLATITSACNVVTITRKDGGEPQQSLSAVLGIAPVRAVAPEPSTFDVTTATVSLKGLPSGRPYTLAVTADDATVEGLACTGLEPWMKVELGMLHAQPAATGAAVIASIECKAPSLRDFKIELEFAASSVEILTASLDLNSTLHASFQAFLVSDDGSRFAFSAPGQTLFPATQAGAPPALMRQVYVQDQRTGKLQLVSTVDGKTEADRPAIFERMSPNGRFVWFRSLARNLGITTTFYKNYVKDTEDSDAPLEILESRLATVLNPSLRVQYYAINDDFTHAIAVVTYMGCGGSLPTDVPCTALRPVKYYRFELFKSTPPTLVLELPRQVDGYGFYSYRPFVSANGRYLAFLAPSLGVGTELTDASKNQIYLKDLASPGAAPVLISTPNGTTLSNGDTYEVVISDDGRTVAFTTDARNLFATVPSASRSQIIAVKDLTTGNNLPALNISSGPSGMMPSTRDPIHARPAITRDGRFVAFQGMAGNAALPAGVGAIWLWDRQVAQTPGRVVTSSDQTSDGLNDHFTAAPRFSDDMKKLIFYSTATNLTKPAGASFVLFKDLNDVAKPARALSPPTVAFESFGSAERWTVSPDGRYLAVEMGYTNLVRPHEEQNVPQILVKDLTKPELGFRIASSTNGLPSGGGRGGPSRLPRFVRDPANKLRLEFLSRAPNLVGGTEPGVIALLSRSLEDLAQPPIVVRVATAEESTEFGTGAAPGLPVAIGNHVYSRCTTAELAPLGIVRTGQICRRVSP